MIATDDHERRLREFRRLRSRVWAIFLFDRERGGKLGGFARLVLVAGLLAIVAPCRLTARLKPLASVRVRLVNARVGIDASRLTKFTGAGLVRINSLHRGLPLIVQYEILYHVERDVAIPP